MTGEPVSSNPLVIDAQDSIRRTCEGCGLAWALYVDSEPDKNVEGMNLNECGYSRHYYCAACARRRFDDIGNTSRMTKLTEQAQ